MVTWVLEVRLQQENFDVDGPVRVIETIEIYDTSGGTQDWFVSSASFGFHNGTGVGFDYSRVDCLDLQSVVQKESV